MYTGAINQTLTRSYYAYHSYIDLIRNIGENIMLSSYPVWLDFRIGYPLFFNIYMYFFE